MIPRRTKSARRHTVTLMSKPGCHLCDDARAVILRVVAEVGAGFEELDITHEGLDLVSAGTAVAGVGL